MSGRTRRFSLVAVATLAFAAAAAPARASCPTTDIACLVEETGETGEGVVEDAIDPVDTPVDDTVEDVVGVVAPVVDDGLDRLDELLGGGIDPPDPGIDPGGGGGGGGTGSPPAGKDPRVPREGLGGRGAAGGPLLGGLGLVPPPVTSVSAPDGTVPTRPERSFGDRLGGALRGAARSSLILLALFGLALAFVTIQDRLDRKDPRLALAPIESDVVEFA